MSLPRSLSGRILLAAAAGPATHVFVFIRGEWHMQAPIVFRFYLALIVAICVAELYGTGDYFERLGRASASIGTYLISMMMSICLYRLRFHRLRSFPGPFWASTSKFWHVFKCLRSNSKNYLVLDDLHKRYGDFVRTGPSELTIFHPDVLAAMDGLRSSCSKSVWYDIPLPELAVSFTRDKQEHDQRRRIWDHGFTTKALEHYEERIAEYGVLLEGRIAKLAASGGAVDICRWFYWFSFDVMGEFAFARSFGMMRDEKWHHAVIFLRRAMGILGPLSPIPWLVRIGFSVSPNFWVVRDWNTMMSWCKDRMAERIDMKPETVDISSFLIEASRKNLSLEKDRNWLNGDAFALVIAGSDTVAPTMIFLFLELARHPKQAEKLYMELSGVSYRDHKALQVLPHLNGLINETLRLHPPVPSGGYRLTPAEGIVVAGKCIPGDTTIVAPRYTISRLESCYEHADQFIPERWYSKPEMVRNKSAFQPFAQGRYSCAGKNLALIEIRLVTAMLVSKYHIDFAQGEDGLKAEKDLRDNFTASPGSLKLRFRPRK